MSLSLWFTFLKFSDVYLDFMFFRICKEFEDIRDTALKVPETTEEMTAMITYIEHVKTKAIQELTDRINVCNSRSHAPVYFYLSLL